MAENPIAYCIAPPGAKDRKEASFASQDIYASFKNPFEGRSGRKMGDAEEVFLWHT
jgi:hypothetical protein